MRKFIRIISCLVLAGFLFSCEADDKNPIPFEFEDGGWVRFQDAPDFALNVANLDEAIFSSTLIDPIGNAVSYQVDVIATVGGTVMDTVPYRTITNFPTEFTITPQALAEALGLDVDLLSGGDSFKFLGSVTTDEGIVYTAKAPAFSDETGYNGGLTSSPLNDAAGYRDALDFTINFVCPFDASASAGTYEIITDAFGTSVGDNIFEVVAGPGENQVTMVNPFDHINPVTGEQDYKVIIDVDPTTGVATIAKQPAWHYSNFAASPAYGAGSINTSGSANFVFSCNGKISVTLAHTVAAGGFGSFKFIAEKMIE